MPWLAPESVDLVWFSGPDTVRFLNDIISQEIGSTPSGRVTRSLLLGPNGKMGHILWVLRGDDLVGLITDEGRGEELGATLTRYRIRVKVDIEPEARPRWVVIDDVVTSGIWSGDRAGDLDADISWAKAGRRLVVGERPDLEVGSVARYESMRISSGEPRWGVDVDEKTIPQESGLVPVTVDFAKGCYLGQELVARINSRGHVNRHLRLLELADPVPTGSPVAAPGREDAGSVSSVADKLALGMIRKEVEPGERVTVGGTTAVVRELPGR